MLANDLRISNEPYDYMYLAITLLLRTLRMLLRVLPLLANASWMKRLHNTCVSNCITLSTLSQYFTMSLIRKSASSSHPLLSRNQVLSLFKSHDFILGGGRNKCDIVLLKTKTASDGAASNDQTNTSSKKKPKVKAVRKPRPKKTDSEQDEMPDSQTPFSLPLFPKPRSSHSRSPTGAVSSWLRSSKTPCLNRLPLPQYQPWWLPAEQLTVWGTGSENARRACWCYLEQWFQSCHIVISKCKARTSDTNWNPFIYGIPNTMSKVL